MYSFEILKKIKSPNELKKLSFNEMKKLSFEIRKYLISISENSDIHLSSNLGIVELSIALLYIFDVPNDKLFYDTGHQCYVHKILTGRMEQIKKARKQNGISGFPSPIESKYDIYGTGHAGTAISVAMGMIINSETYVIPVIGDASICNGVAFEALNNIDLTQKKIIIVVNDNGMAISQSVGSIAKMFNKIKMTNIFYTAEKTAQKLISPKKGNNKMFSWLFNSYNFIEQKISGKNIFQVFGFQYIGPIDGNNINKTIKALKKAKWYSQHKPTVIHFKTKKGLGLKEAEQDSLGIYHSFSKNFKKTIGNDISEYLCKKIKQNENIRLINPAMGINSGMKKIIEKYPNNFYDVGISEEHAFAFASGMKLNGLIPIINIYSCFLTRSIDFILSDWSNMNISNICLIDRADLSPGDGDSHHGIYDIGLLKNTKGNIITTFRNKHQMQQLIDIALQNKKNNFFIRYSKSYFSNNKIDQPKFKVTFGCWEKVIDEKQNKNLFITYGPYTNKVKDYIYDNNIKFNLWNAIFINNFNKENLKSLAKYEKIIVYERVYGAQLANDIQNYLLQNNIKTKLIIKNYDGNIGFGDLDKLDEKQKMNLKSIF